MLRQMVFAGAILFAPTLALAQSQIDRDSEAPHQPTIQAMAYDTIPEGAAFDTQANDDSELNLEALDAVKAGLERRSYRIDAQAPYVMVVETNLVRGQKQDNPLGRAYADNNEAKIEGRLFSTTQNSLINPPRPIGSADRLYRINISVYRRDGGLYVWRGIVYRNDPEMEVTKATGEMVAALLAKLGQTVEPPNQ